MLFLDKFIWHDFKNILLSVILPFILLILLFTIIYLISGKDKN